MMSAHAVTFSCPTRYGLGAVHLEKPRRLTNRRKRLVRASAEEEEFSVPINGNNEEPEGKTVADKLEGYRKEAIRAAEAQEFAEKYAPSRINEEIYYSDNWEGDVYVGSNWNILTVILFISIAVPIAGLIFAYFSYGTLWGIDSQAI